MNLAGFRDHFIYDPDLGEFWRLKKQGSNAAGSLVQNNPKGYTYIRYKAQQAKAARVAWWWMTGEWPVNCVIDHINRNKKDDRWCNLRKITHQQNCTNRKHRGTSLFRTPKRNGKGHDEYYMARVVSNYKIVHCSYHKTEQEAHKAYLKAKAIHHKHYFNK